MMPQFHSRPLPCEESSFVHNSLQIRRQLDDRSGEEKNRGRAMCISSWRRCMAVGVGSIYRAGKAVLHPSLVHSIDFVKSNQSTCFRVERSSRIDVSLSSGRRALQSEERMREGYGNRYFCGEEYRAVADRVSFERSRVLQYGTQQLYCCLLLDEERRKREFGCRLSIFYSHS